MTKIHFKEINFDLVSVVLVFLFRLKYKVRSIESISVFIPVLLCFVCCSLANQQNDDELISRSENQMEFSIRFNFVAVVQIICEISVCEWLSSSRCWLALVRNKNISTEFALLAAVSESRTSGRLAEIRLTSINDFNSRTFYSFKRNKQKKKKKTVRVCCRHHARVRARKPIEWILHRIFHFLIRVLLLPSDRERRRCVVLCFIILSSTCFCTFNSSIFDAMFRCLPFCRSAFFVR